MEHWQEAYLVLSSCPPVRELRRIRDPLLQPVSAERAERHGRRAVYAADCPEGRHGVVVVMEVESGAFGGG